MMQCTYPLTTPCRKPEALSTTSSQTLDTRLSSKSVASGRDCRASSDSCNSSLHRSESSPDRHARRRKAKAKLRAALDPTLAKPIVAFSAGFMELKFRLTFYSLHQIRFVKLFRHVSRKRNHPVTFEIKIYWYMCASHVLAWSTCVEIKWTWQDYLTLNCTGKTTKLLNLILYKKNQDKKDHDLLILYRKDNKITWWLTLTFSVCWGLSGLPGFSWRVVSPRLVTVFRVQWRIAGGWLASAVAWWWRLRYRTPRCTASGAHTAPTSSTVLTGLNLFNETNRY